MNTYLRKPKKSNFNITKTSAMKIIWYGMDCINVLSYENFACIFYNSNTFQKSGSGQGYAVKLHLYTKWLNFLTKSCDTFFCFKQPK